VSTSVAPDGSTYRYTWDGAGMMSRLTIDSTAPPRPNCPACKGPTLDVGHLYTADNERIATLRFITGADFFLAPWESIAWSVRHPSGLLLAQWKDVPADDGYFFTRDREYVWRGSTLLATLEPWIGGPLPLYHHADHLGSRRVVSDTFAIADTQDYAPFGAGGLEGAGPLQFTGHERDTNIGPEYLDYMHARFYNPNWGRFLSVDPAGGAPRMPQTWNRYTYVMNNPLNLTDPFGLYPCPTRGSDGQIHTGECIDVKGKFPKARNPRGAGGTILDLIRFIRGGSPRHLAASQDSTEELRNTPAMDNIRKDFIDQQCRAGTYSSDFQSSEFLETTNVTGHLVGAFKAKMVPIRNGLVVVHARNTWGLESATRIPGKGNRLNASVEELSRMTWYPWGAHGGPGMPRSVLNDKEGGAFGNLTMHYIWIEELPCEQ
jgi:RHS repeat-associated protein